MNLFRTRYRIDKRDDGILIVKVRYWWDIFGWLRIGGNAMNMECAMEIIKMDRNRKKKPVTVYEE